MDGINGENDQQEWRSGIHLTNTTQSMTYHICLISDCDIINFRQQY